MIYTQYFFCELRKNPAVHVVRPHSMPPHRWSACTTCRRVGGQYHRFRVSGNLFHTSSGEAVCIHALSASMTENQGIAGSSFFLKKGAKKTGTIKIDPPSHILCEHKQGA